MNRERLEFKAICSIVTTLTSSAWFQQCGKCGQEGHSERTCTSPEANKEGGQSCRPHS